MAFAPCRAQLGRDPVGGLVVGEVGTEGRGEIVVFHRRALVCFHCFAAEVTELMLAHVLEVERSHDGGVVMYIRVKVGCGVK
jgi:hypothetical protein